MDQNAGRFISPEEKERQTPQDQLRIERMPQLGMGEIVEIKGVKFKVAGIQTRGRLRLKILSIPL